MSRDGKDKLKQNIISGSNFRTVSERKICFLALKQTVPNCFGVDFDHFFHVLLCQQDSFKPLRDQNLQKIAAQKRYFNKTVKTLNSSHIVCVYTIEKIPFEFQIIKC